MTKIRKMLALLFVIALLSSPAFLLGCEVEEEEPLDDVESTLEG